MRLALALSISATLASCAPAQGIIVTPGPTVPAGITLSISAWGSPTAPLSINGTSAFLLTSTGDLVWPRFRQGATTVFSVGTPPGMTLQLTSPTTGAGSSGSFVVFVPSSAGPVGPAGPPGFHGLVSRINVGTATPGFPALHTFPIHVVNGFGSYATFAWQFAGTAEWCLANTSASSITLDLGDSIQVFAPGGTTPLLVLPLAGVTIPPRQVISVTVFGAALPPAPYIVQVNWVDPIAGPIVRRTGIHGSQLGAGGDLHLPQGRIVPLGGAIEAYVQLPFMTALPAFALLAGFEPGSTVLPNGAVIGVVPDALVLASLSGALSPFLSGSPGIATPTSVGCVGYCGPGGSGSLSTAIGIFLAHPGPANSGTVLRLAAIALAPPGVWIPSQPQEITLQ